MEKPAALAEEDASSLAAALMAQRPPCDVLRKRPCEDALLEAERSHQRRLIAQLDWELLGETLCRVERERENRNLRRRVDGLNNIMDREREQARESWSAATEFSASGWRTLARSSCERTDELEDAQAKKKDPELSFSCFLDNAYSIRRSCSK